MTDKGPRQFSEEEAAVEVGVSVEQLRALIRSQITGPEESPSQGILEAFQSSDIVLLRILAASRQPASV